MMTITDRIRNNPLAAGALAGAMALTPAFAAQAEPSANGQANMTVANYTPSIATQAAYYSDEHNVVTVTVVMNPKLPIRPQQIISTFEQRFDDQGIPSKVFVDLDEMAKSAGVEMFYKYAYGPFSLREALDAVERLAVHYIAENVEDNPSLNLPPGLR